MKKNLIKSLVGTTAAVTLLAVGLTFVQNDKIDAKAAAPTAVITMEGASMRYDTAGLRFCASMTKSDFESFIYPAEGAYVDGSFEVGMLVIPESELGDSKLEVGNADALNLTMTWNGTLVDEFDQEDENGTKVLFKGYVDDVPMKNYETKVVGRAYYRSGTDYVYSEQAVRSLLGVAEAAYADETEQKPSDEQKAVLYSDHLKPYYTTVTDFEITALVGSTTPSIVSAYDSANKALTVTMPKYAKDGAGQNAIRTMSTYAPGTYVMMEFTGADHPGMIVFGDTMENVSTGDYNCTGVSFWVDDYYQLSCGYTGSWTGRAVKDSTSNLRRQYFESKTTTNFVLIAGAEVDATDSTKTDLKYYLYEEKNGMLVLNNSGALEDVPYTLTEGKIQVRTVKNGAATETAPEAIIKMYQPDTLANIMTTMKKAYVVDDATEKFDKTSSATVSTNADGTYQLNIPMVPSNDGAYNYVATKAQYGSGTYLMAEFVKETQNSVPSMILFGVDNVTETPVFATGTGVGYGKQQTTWNGVGVCTDNWNKIVGFYHKEETASYVAQSGATFCRRADDVGSHYVLIIGAENVGTDVKVEYTLYKKSDTTLTFVESYSHTFANASVSNGNIVFASPHYGSDSVADIKLWTIGSKTDVESKLNSVYTIAQA